MGNDGSKDPRVRAQTINPGGRGGNPRIRSQTTIAENDFLREKHEVYKPQNPTEQDFLTREPHLWKGKESEPVRKRNDEICSKLALGFAQVDNDRDGFIDRAKVTQIYKQTCKFANAVYSPPVFPSNRVGFLQWNNLFKNIPAGDKHLAKALKQIDFLTFKESTESGTGITRSYIDNTLGDEAEVESKKRMTDFAPQRKHSSSGGGGGGTPPTTKPITVVLHTPSPTTTTEGTTDVPPVLTIHKSPPEGKKTLKDTSGATSKPRKPSSTMPPTTKPVLPTGIRPLVPRKGSKEIRTGLRPPVTSSSLSTKPHRRSRANTGDSEVSAVSSIGDIGDIDDIADEETDFGPADADLPSSQPKNSTLTSPPSGTTGVSPDTTSPVGLRKDDDDDDDTNASMIARANAVWS